MAKNSQQQALLTEKRIHQAIVDIFMEKGWEAITYGSIAKHTGLSRGGVQRIVPSKEAMTEAFQGQVYQYILGQLDLSDKNKTIQTWETAFVQPKFQNCIKFLITSVNAPLPGRVKTKQCLDALKGKIGKETLYNLLGWSVYALI